MNRRPRVGRLAGLVTAALPEPGGRLWPLADLAGVSEIAARYEMGRAAVCNWPKRYPDFPSPLIDLMAGPVYSRSEVHQWYTARWPRRATR